MDNFNNSRPYDSLGGIGTVGNDKEKSNQVLDNKGREY